MDELKDVFGLVGAFGLLGIIVKLVYEYLAMQKKISLAEAERIMSKVKEDKHEVHSRINSLSDDQLAESARKLADEVRGSRRNH